MPIVEIIEDKDDKDKKFLKLEVFEMSCEGFTYKDESIDIWTYFNHKKLYQEILYIK